MANISTLTVSLVAQTGKFENDLKKARGSAQKFGKAVTAGFKIAGAAVGALTVSLAALTKQSLAVVDQQRKAARVLGTSQEVYSGLALAAGIAGVNVTAFDKALKRQAKSISDARDGLLTQKRALDRLNLSAETLINLPVEQAFAQITTALGKVESQTLKVAIASDIYGARNSDLINIIDLGAEGLTRYIEKTKELGVALTDRQTDAIEKTNDALLVMRTAFSGLGNQLAASFGPTIIRTAEAITSLVSTITNSLPAYTAWLGSLTGIRRELQNLTLEQLRADYARTQSDLTELREQIDDLRSQADPFDLEGTGGDSLLQIRINEADELERRLDRNIAQQKELISGGEVAAGGGTISGAPTSTAQPITKADQELKKLDARFGGIRSITQGMVDDIQTWRDEAAAAAAAVRTPFEQFQLELQRIREELATNPFISDETVTRTTAKAVEAYQAQMAALKETNDTTVNAVTEFWTQSFRSMQSGLSQFLFDPFEDGLSGMVKGFANTLRQMVADLLASKLLTLFFGQFPGIGQFIGPISSTPGSRIGGPIGANQTRLVGEGGPELFTPGAKGSVRPLGAVTVNSTLNIQGGGGLDGASLIPILEENNKKLKSELLDEFDRGAFA